MASASTGALRAPAPGLQKRRRGRSRLSIRTVTDQNRHRGRRSTPRMGDVTGDSRPDSWAEAIDPMKFVRLDFVLLRSLASLAVVLAITLSGWWPAGSVSSAAEMPIGATLKVLALPVEVEVAQTQSFVAAMDGQMLSQGD